MPPKEQLDQFLAGQKKIHTDGGLEAPIIDLTQLQSKEDMNSPSMMGTIIELPDATVFVKMTGSRRCILQNKEKFEALCQSLKLN